MNMRNVGAVGTPHNPTPHPPRQHQISSSHSKPKTQSIIIISLLPIKIRYRKREKKEKKEKKRRKEEKKALVENSSKKRRGMVMGMGMAHEDACPAHCAAWARDYIGYCLCTTTDAVSLWLGFISVVSWGVAEIPQILTNFKTKSADGLSFAFLLTWILGDFFNMFGCLLEPATLPTQFYMALLYTVTTLTLTLQTIYYGHIYHRLKCNRKDAKPSQMEVVGEYSADKRNGGEKLINGSGGKRPVSSVLQNEITMSSPIPLPAFPRSHSAGQDSFYKSARSLSTSHTPTRSFVAPRRDFTTVDSEDPIQEPLLGGSLPNRPEHLSKTKNLLCIVPAMLLFLGTLNISSTKDTSQSLAFKLSNRKLLQVNDQLKMTSGFGGGIGTYMGWAMAAIYMGGRLPQISLNIRRGHVEGLNPLMFFFALLGNTTYVASILVNSLDWSKIMPNLPWLVDAGGCALLDTFILLQFIYFQRRRSSHLLTKHEDTYSQ